VEMHVGKRVNHMQKTCDQVAHNTVVFTDEQNKQKKKKWKKKMRAQKANKNATTKEVR
jgi:Neuraminidase (sialidase)